MKTNTPSSHSLYTSTCRLCLRRHSPGFSLVEMLIVVAIASLMLAMVAPYTLSIIQAANLTSAGDTLMQKLAQAQQRSATENRPVGLDFYYYTQDEVKGCHAIQLISYDPATSTATPLESPVYLSASSVVLVDGALSPMFATNLPPTSTGPVMRAPFQTLGATFRRLVFYPNGSTSLRVPLRTAYLTLISVKNFTADLTTPPPNYYTVQLDPVTGRGHSYRP